MIQLGGIVNVAQANSTIQVVEGNTLMCLFTEVMVV